MKTGTWVKGKLLFCVPPLETWCLGAAGHKVFYLQAAKLVRIILVTGLFCGGQATPTPQPHNITVSLQQKCFSLEPTLSHVLPQEGVIFHIFY